MKPNIFNLTLTLSFLLFCGNSAIASKYVMPGELSTGMTKEDEEMLIDLLNNADRPCPENGGMAVACNMIERYLCREVVHYIAERARRSPELKKLEDEPITARRTAIEAEMEKIGEEILDRYISDMKTGQAGSSDLGSDRQLIMLSFPYKGGREKGYRGCKEKIAGSVFDYDPVNDDHREYFVETRVENARIIAMEFHGGGLGEGHLHRNLILQKMLHTYKDAATISFTERPEIIWAALDRLFKEIEVKTQELRIPVWRPYVTKEEREKAGAPLFWAGFTLSAIVALPTFRFGQTWWNKGRTWFAGMRGTSGGAGRLRLNGPGAGSAVGNANHSFGRRLLGRWKYNWWPKIRGMLGYFFYKAKKPSTPAASSTSPASSTSVATQGTLPTHPYRPASGGSSPVSPVTMLPAVQNTAIGPGVAGAAAKANGPWFRTMWPGLGKKLTAGVPRLVKPVAGAALVGLAGGGLYRFFQLRKIQQWPPMTTLRVGQEWIARHVLKDQVKTFKFRLENLIDQKEKGLFPGEYTDPGLMRINEELDLIERDMQRIESQIKYLSKALHENGGSPLVSSVEGVTSLATLIGDDINLVRDHCLVIKEILAERGLINFDENIRAQLANRLVSTINRNYNWLQSWKKRVDGDEDAEPMPSLTQDEFDDFYNSFVEISANFSDRKAQAERYATLTNAAGEPLITDLETLSERVVKNGKVADELIDAFDKLVVDQAEELEDQVADEMEENAAAASEAGPDLPTPTESVTNPAALEPESPSAEQTSAGHANPK